MNRDEDAPFFKVETDFESNQGSPNASPSKSLNKGVLTGSPSRSSREAEPQSPKSDGSFEFTFGPGGLKLSTATPRAATSPSKMESMPEKQGSTESFEEPLSQHAKNEAFVCVPIESVEESLPLPGSCPQIPANKPPVQAYIPAPPLPPMSQSQGQAEVRYQYDRYGEYDQQHQEQLYVEQPAHQQLSQHPGIPGHYTPPQLAHQPSYDEYDQAATQSAQLAALAQAAAAMQLAQVNQYVARQQQEQAAAFSHEQTVKATGSCCVIL